MEEPRVEEEDDRPLGWQFDLFNKVFRRRLAYEMEEDRRRQGSVISRVSDDLFLDWLTGTNNQLQSLYKRVVETSLVIKEALNSTDTSKIVDAAHQTLDLYRDTLDWSRQVKDTQVPVRAQMVKEELRKMASGIERVVPTIADRLEDLIEAIRESRPEGKVNARMVLDIGPLNEEAFISACKAFFEGSGNSARMVPARRRAGRSSAPPVHVGGGLDGCTTALIALPVALFAGTMKGILAAIKPPRR
jgi:hypothetical protein